MSEQNSSDKALSTAFEQRPANEALAKSPLAGVDLTPVTGPEPIIVSEREAGHLTLRGEPEVISAAVGATLDLALPIIALTSVANETTCIRWLSPDEWLITVAASETFAVESSLRARATGHMAVVNVSGGQTLITLKGPRAVDVLMKSTSYDVDVRNFPPGKVVTTTLAQTQAVIRRIHEDEFEVIIRRSFADYLWAWLRDASTEFGFLV